MERFGLFREIYFLYRTKWLENVWAHNDIVAGMRIEDIARDAGPDEEISLFEEGNQRKWEARASADTKMQLWVETWEKWSSIWAH